MTNFSEKWDNEENFKDGQFKKYKPIILRIIEDHLLKINCCKHNKFQIIIVGHIYGFWKFRFCLVKVDSVVCSECDFSWSRK